MTVQRVLCDYRPALIRDLIALGYRATDLFTPRLSFYELTCIIIAATPYNSSVRYFLDGGWSREAQLLANQQEYQAGFAQLTKPYERPGQIMETGDGRSAANPFGNTIFKADEFSWEEFDRLEAERYANAGATGGGGGRRLL